MQITARYTACQTVSKHAPDTLQSTIQEEPPLMLRNQEKESMGHPDLRVRKLRYLQVRCEDQGQTASKRWERPVHMERTKGRVWGFEFEEESLLSEDFVLLLCCCGVAEGQVMRKPLKLEPRRAWMEAGKAHSRNASLVCSGWKVLACPLPASWHWIMGINEAFKVAAMIL